MYVMKLTISHALAVGAALDHYEHLLQEQIAGMDKVRDRNGIREQNAQLDATRTVRADLNKFLRG